MEILKKLIAWLRPAAQPSIKPRIQIKSGTIEDVCFFHNGEVVGLNSGALSAVTNVQDLCSRFSELPAFVLRKGDQEIARLTSQYLVAWDGVKRVGFVELRKYKEIPPALRMSNPLLRMLPKQVKSYRGPDEAEVLYLYVCGDRRGQKISSALLVAAIGHLESEGFDAILARIYRKKIPSNPPCEAALASMGFKPNGKDGSSDVLVRKSSSSEYSIGNHDGASRDLSAKESRQYTE